jgi:hypothetical protein
VYGSTEGTVVVTAGGTGTGLGEGNVGEPDALGEPTTSVIATVRLVVIKFVYGSTTGSVVVTARGKGTGFLGEGNVGEPDALGEPTTSVIATVTTEANSSTQINSHPIYF